MRTRVLWICVLGTLAWEGAAAALGVAAYRSRTHPVPFTDRRGTIEELLDSFSYPERAHFTTTGRLMLIAAVVAAVLGVVLAALAAHLLRQWRGGERASAKLRPAR